MHPQHGVEDKFRFSTFCFRYITYLVQFVLSVIPERKKSVSYEILIEVNHYTCVCHTLDKRVCLLFI